ncbi:hypothetical protein [Bartonella sp. HY406]|uniref:hypothetical protein n=1 Tax=Bartonella sp. HY406 TaxID=2979331 RepID=UPI0021C9BFDD|nr:hypothetical protein [Bartonella sp. HY406]UXN04226.1 hypothetical protein N6B01_04115 [Bartonella sp. HY406]
MRYIFLIASILTSFIAFQTHSFANGGPVERVGPVPELSPELQKITDHHYDYPYSKNYTYPDEIYERRKRIENDIYSNYIRERIPERGSGIAKHFKEDSQIYALALKIGLCQKITDTEVEAIKDRINQKYSGDTLLELAIAQMNLEAIDLLFKYGADPFISYEEDYAHVDRSDLNFMYQMSETFNPGFSVDVIRLFVKYKLNPNHVFGRKINDAAFGDNGMTFLAYMVLIKNELAWVSLMEGGGNPWAKFKIGGRIMNIAAYAASSEDIGFLDYVIENGYLKTASKEDIEDLIAKIMEMPLYADYAGTESRQRILQSIIEQTDIVPTKEMFDYINWRGNSKTESIDYILRKKY